jgi:hypothetical membrane protein
MNNTLIYVAIGIVSVCAFVYAEWTGIECRERGGAVIFLDCVQIFGDER